MAGGTLGDAATIGGRAIGPKGGTLGSGGAGSATSRSSTAPAAALASPRVTATCRPRLNTAVAPEAGPRSRAQQAAVAPMARSNSIASCSLSQVVAQSSSPALPRAPMAKASPPQPLAACSEVRVSLQALSNVLT